MENLSADSRCKICTIGKAVEKVGRVCGIFINHKDEKNWKCPYFKKTKEEANWQNTTIKNGYNPLATFTRTTERRMTMRPIDAEALENENVKTMRYVPKDAVLDVACMVNRAPTISLSDKRNYEAETKELVKIFLENFSGNEKEIEAFCKIPVISMEDVPKTMEELPSVEENPILKAVKEMEK